MNSVSTRGLVPLAIASLSSVSYPTVQTFKYNDVEQNNIQLIDDSALSHLKSAQGINYGYLISRFKFYQAFEKWNESVRFLSSPIQIVNDPDFKVIVSMGYTAIPYIIEELEKEPSYLVWALNQIFEFKISDNPSTTIPEARKAWLKYLKSLQNA
jgi:hypothetical protein